MESYDAIVSVLRRWKDYMRRTDIEEFETYRHKELRNGKDLGLHVQTEEEK
jgi:hypothetical protein|nr:MAG TPA: hypothetical protein [Caudoviricetes sp.]